MLLHVGLDDAVIDRVKDLAFVREVVAMSGEQEILSTANLLSLRTMGKVSC